MHFICSHRLLQAAIQGLSSFFPDYQERVARHEAAHFLRTLPNIVLYPVNVTWLIWLLSNWKLFSSNYSCLSAWSSYSRIFAGYRERERQSYR